MRTEEHWRQTARSRSDWIWIAIVYAIFWPILSVVAANLATIEIVKHRVEQRVEELFKTQEVEAGR